MIAARPKIRSGCPLQSPGKRTNPGLFPSTPNLEIQMSWKERMIKLCGQLRPWLPALALAAVAMTPNLAFALATPVDGDFGYDVYGIMVNKGLKGPLGNAV